MNIRFYKVQIVAKIFNLVKIVKTSKKYLIYIPNKLKYIDDSIRFLFF